MPHLWRSASSHCRQFPSLAWAVSYAEFVQHDASKCPEALRNHNVRGDEVLSNCQSSDSPGFECAIRSEDHVGVVPGVFACLDSLFKNIVPLELDHLLEEHTLSKKCQLSMVVVTRCKFKTRLVAAFKHTESVDQENGYKWKEPRIRSRARSSAKVLKQFASRRTVWTALHLSVGSVLTCASHSDLCFEAHHTSQLLN